MQTQDFNKSRFAHARNAADAQAHGLTCKRQQFREQRIRLRFASQAGFGGTWEANLRAEEGKTIIAIEEKVTISSPLGRIFSRLFFDPQKFATTYLAELTSRVEGK